MAALYGCTVGAEVTHVEHAPNPIPMTRAFLAVDCGSLRDRAEGIRDHLVSGLRARAVTTTAVVATGIELDPSFRGAAQDAGAEVLLRVVMSGGGHRHQPMEAVLTRVPSGEVLWYAHVHGEQGVYALGSSNGAISDAIIAQLSKNGFLPRSAP